MLSSQKIVSLFLVLSSLYVAMAQLPSVLPSVSTATNQAQCRKEGLALYAERRKADCGQKTIGRKKFAHLIKILNLFFVS